MDIFMAKATGCSEAGRRVNKIWLAKPIPKTLTTFNLLTTCPIFWLQDLYCCHLLCFHLSFLLLVSSKMTKKNLWEKIVSNTRNNVFVLKYTWLNSLSVTLWSLIFFILWNSYISPTLSLSSKLTFAYFRFKVLISGLGIEEISAI